MGVPEFVRPKQVHVSLLSGELVGVLQDKTLHTGVEFIFQALYDGRASTESIDTFLLVSLRRFQILNTAKDDRRKTSDACHI
jgi:hypothetical protein